LLGVGFFFGGRVHFTARELPGVIWALVALFSFALSGLVGRTLGREGRVPPLVLTSGSMLAGAGLLLPVALIRQGPLHPTLPELGILLWMIVVNTALAFTLWNATLSRLTAVESSVLTNVMVVEIALAAWLFLHEPLTPLKIVGMVLTVIGALLVQRRPARVEV
jgi:drug/metabolite transporter (DMT)-like permease